MYYIAHHTVELNQQNSELQRNHELEMWANAQRDGCPAEHRRRPLFNAAKFG